MSDAMDYDTPEQVKRLAEAERTARRILGVGQDAGRDEVRRAWLRVCRHSHPDKRQDDDEARDRFLAARAAYEFLVDGTPSRRLFEQADGESAELRSGDYNVENRWGYLLWWRDRYGF